MSIRIGILGTRGIPNHYGGFERLAEQLSCALADMGHEVFVYNSHNHLYQEKKWNDVHIVHCYDPEFAIGCAGQFIYDLNCLLDARTKKFDIILMLGYTSSSVWRIFFPEKAIFLYNMDGMEWKRTKYSKITRKFLQYAEKLAVKNGHYHIADSPAIQSYYEEKYGLKTEYIAYGAEIFTHENEECLKEYEVARKDYYLLVARMEPENNVETILEGFHKSTSGKKFLVAGNVGNHFGRHLVKKFAADKRIRFIGAVYDEQKIHSLRVFCHLYFHGHSTGGTNPSLLEAMASRACIIAHDNIFNHSVLQDDALYFTSPADIQRIIEQDISESFSAAVVKNNSIKILKQYNWQNIFQKYERFMLHCLYQFGNERNILHKRYAG